MSESKIQISKISPIEHKSIHNLNYFDLFSKIDLSKYENKILEKKRASGINMQSKSHLTTQSKSHIKTPHNSPVVGPIKVKYDESITVKSVKLSI
jgi:hypothetical protein